MLYLLLGVFVGWAFFILIGFMLFRYFVKDDQKTRSQYLDEMANSNIEYYH